MPVYMLHVLKKYSPLIRFLFSAGLVCYLVMTVDFAPLEETLPLFQWRFYATGLLVMCLYVMLQAFILVRLLNARGVPVIWSQMIRLNVMSSFFGVFLPGGSGSDVVMAVSLCRNEHDKAEVASSIIFARVAGLAAMVLLAYVVSEWAGSAVPGVNALLFSVLVVLALIVLLNAVGLTDVVEKKVLTVFPGSRVIQFIARFIHSMTSMGRSGRLMLVVMPAFLVMGVGRAAMDYFMAKSLGVVIPFSNFILFSTVVSLVTILPISIAGLGVREVTFVGLFALVGVPQSMAVSISLLSFSLSLWVCLVGGITYAGAGWNHTA